MDATRLAERIALVAGQRDLLAVYVFGSTAGGTQTPLSDLDLAVLLPDSVPEQEYFERRLTLAGELSSLLSEDRVDLVLLNEAPPLLRHRVVTRGTRVYTGNERACSAFERRAISEYLDLAPVLELQHRYLARRVAEGRLGARHHHGSVSPAKLESWLPRNILIHDYLDGDFRRVHRYIRESRGDFAAFAQAVLRLTSLGGSSTEWAPRLLSA